MDIQQSILLKVIVNDDYNNNIVRKYVASD